MGEMTITKSLLLYIEENLGQELTLGKIAKEFNYSKFYLARKFKEDTGCTLHQYIRGRRLDEAAGKLVKTGKPIVEIAYEAGYDSQQAFTQAFRTEYLYTPQEYRRIGVFVPEPNRVRIRSNVISGISISSKFRIFLFKDMKGGIAA